MTEAESSTTIPAGFEVHTRRSPVTDPWQPLYTRVDDEVVVLALVVGERHCNGRGFLHGGVIASLADNAMGLSVHRASQTRATPIDGGALTLGLSVDYLSTAAVGTWVEIRSRVHSLGRSIGVVDALVVDDAGGTIARANASFRYRRSAVD